MKLNNLQKRIISFNTTVVFGLLLQTALIGVVTLLHWNEPNFMYILKIFWFVMLILFLGMGIFGTLAELTVHNTTSVLRRYKEWKTIDYKKINEQLRMSEEGREKIVL